MGRSEVSPATKAVLDDPPPRRKSGSNEELAKAHLSLLDDDPDLQVKPYRSLRYRDRKVELCYSLARETKMRRHLRKALFFLASVWPLLMLLDVLASCSTSFGLLDHDSTTTSLHVFPDLVLLPMLQTLVGLLFLFPITTVSLTSKPVMVLGISTHLCHLLHSSQWATRQANVWMHTFLSLGLTSLSGLKYHETQLVSVVSTSVFLTLTWLTHVRVNHTHDDDDDDAHWLKPLMQSLSVLMHCCLLAYVSWHWELGLRRQYLGQSPAVVAKARQSSEISTWFEAGVEASSSKADAGEIEILNQNCRIDRNDLLLEEELGSGNFGCVFRGMWKQTKVAVKQLHLKDNKRELLKNFGAEATVMARLRHPNIVMFMGVVLDADFVGVVMEICPKGSVFEIIHERETDLDYSLLLRMLLDSARGMNFLHSNNPPIVHRDLKSMNLLIDADWRCKVSDFGLSKLSNPNGTTNDADLAEDLMLNGTMAWIAPEVFNMERNDTASSDVYAFGVILYEALSRSIPYAQLSPEAIPFLVKSGKRPSDYRAVTQDHPSLVDGTDLMNSCWATDPTVRPSFPTIISRLSHIIETYVGKPDWEDYICFPDRTLGKGEGAVSADFALDERDLSMGQQIGKGVFGAVYSGTYFGTPVAIKKLFVSRFVNQMMQDFKKENMMMERLRHPNIVLYMGSCTNPPNLILVTELLTNGSFFDYYHAQPCPPLKEHAIMCFNLATDMARGLAYLHNHDPVIIHRDLKSQNVMLDEKMTCKIGDFGLSRIRDVGKTMSICGSPLWVAPEVLRGEKYGCPCDVYSFAIILWEAYAWNEPFPDMSSTEVMNGVACGTLMPDMPASVPPGMDGILRSCWQSEPSNRPMFNELVPILENLRCKLLQDAE